MDKLFYLYSVCPRCADTGYHMVVLNKKHIIVMCEKCLIIYNWRLILCEEYM